MNEELKATEALLDIGVSVPLRPIRFRRWKITPRVTIKRPPLGGLLRILRVWFSFGITADGIDKMEKAEQLRFLGQHGRTVSKFVALAICSGYVSGKVFAPLLAWFLRWRCHPDTLLYTISVFMSLIDAKSFMTIIRSGTALNVAAPSLSQKRRS